MKVGTETGSLINHVLSNAASAIPEVGMGATRLAWTDRHPYTIVEVSPNRKTIVVQADTAIRADENGFSEMQQYRYEPNPNAPRITLVFRKNGKWVERGGTDVYIIGHREAYHDFSF